MLFWFVFQSFNMRSFDLATVADCGEVGPVNQVCGFFAPSPADRPKTISNHCLIEHLSLRGTFIH